MAEDFTEELLNMHEVEMESLKKYHEDHKDLFTGVNQWHQNWTLYLELEVSTAYSPGIYSKVYSFFAVNVNIDTHTLGSVLPHLIDINHGCKH